MRQLEDLIRHLLSGAGTVNTCVSEFLGFLQVVLQQLRLSADEVGVRRVLGETIVKAVQRLLGCLLERGRTIDY